MITTTDSVVEGCFVHDTAGSGGDGISLWQGGANSVRDNVLVRTGGPGIVVQMTPSTGMDTIERNFVLNAQDNEIQVEGNAIVRNNLLVGGTNDGVHSRAEITTAPMNVTIVHPLPNAYPTASSTLIDAGDARFTVSDDFNGTPRTGTPDTGAYERTAAQNPGWTPSEMLKPLADAICP